MRCPCCGYYAVYGEEDGFGGWRYWCEDCWWSYWCEDCGWRS